MSTPAKNLQESIALATQLADFFKETGTGGKLEQRLREYVASCSPIYPAKTVKSIRACGAVRLAESTGDGSWIISWDDEGNPDWLVNPIYESAEVRESPDYGAAIGSDQIVVSPPATYSSWEEFMSSRDLSAFSQSYDDFIVEAVVAAFKQKKEQK